MANIITARSTNSGRLERWLGAEGAEAMSRNMRGWYGPPILLADIPGAVWATGDGDFIGPIKAGAHTTLFDYVRGRERRVMREFARRQRGKMNAGFASLSDLISEATTGGKRQDFWFNKVGTASAAAGQPMSLWNVGNFPAAGGTGGAAPAGTLLTRTSTGALGQVNPTGGDTLHMTYGMLTSTTANALMVYDRMWHCTYNHASATSTTITIDSGNGVGRYNSTTPGDYNYAGGNFISGEVTTVLSATAHNITITYQDQANNTAEAAAAYAAPVSAAANRIPLVSPNWFLPLNSGDSGVKDITNISQSTITSVTGVSNFWIGHPLFMLTCPLANIPGILDGINSAFSLVRIIDDACIAFLELPKTATTATTFNGQITLVAG